MSRRIRPSARKKTLHNVMCSALSETDKKCIKEVFEKFELQKAEIEKLTVNMNAFGLGMKQEKQRADEWHREAELTAEKLDGAINAQETLQKALAEKTAEILRLETSNKNKLNLIHDLRSHLNDAHSAAIKKFAERLCEGRVSNDPVVIAVKVELEMAGDTE
ncbi:MAG: hypothetical protein IJ264_05725 [Clostridia bacterium]|nr:hypothetical protein [Clostridia bacterium]